MKSTHVAGIIATLIVVAIGAYTMGQSSAKSSTVASKTETTMTKTSALPGTDTEKIANAMSAAPVDIARNATVMDWPSASSTDMKTLREGSNEWTCLPDDTTTPGNDPICVDKMALQWFGAYMAHKTPKIPQNGIAYMLKEVRLLPTMTLMQQCRKLEMNG